VSILWKDPYWVYFLWPAGLLPLVWWIDWCQNLHSNLRLDGWYSVFILWSVPSYSQRSLDCQIDNPGSYGENLLGHNRRVNRANYWSKGGVRFVHLWKSIEVRWFTVVWSQFIFQGKWEG
jgi:hypothetical protein